MVNYITVMWLTVIYVDHWHFVQKFFLFKLLGEEYDQCHCVKTIYIFWTSDLDLWSFDPKINCVLTFSKFKPATRFNSCRRWNTLVIVHKPFFFSFCQTFKPKTIFFCLSHMQATYKLHKCRCSKAWIIVHISSVIVTYMLELLEPWQWRLNS